MKKTLLIAAAALISASAFAQTVTSANIVGYTKKPTTSGSFSILASQFSEDGVALSNAFSGVSGGVKVFEWTGSIYNEYTYFDGYGWFDGGFNPVGSNLIAQGQAVWLQGAVTTNILMSGEVPSAGSITNVLSAGFNLVASPYPVEITPNDITNAVSGGDKIFEWTGSIYNEYTYFDGYGWFDGGFNPVGTNVISVGDGFWLQSASNTTIILDKQY